MIKKLKKLAFSRIFIVGLLILIQFLILIIVSLQFSKYFVFYSTVSFVLSLIFSLKIIDTDQNMAYKLAWTMMVFAFPVFGTAIYLIFAGNRLSKRKAKKMASITTVFEKNIGVSETDLWLLDGIDKNASKQSRYILNASACPLFSNCSTRYFRSGEEAFPVILEELEKAQRYIFLEYFIIGKGEMWDKIHEILLKKVSEGVNVFVIYDDLGSINVTDLKFASRLNDEGINCKVYHRFVPILNARQNNRDHRKILVIDGITAFTGGINISDEYINTIDRFGYWKDNAIMLKGECAWSFTVMFLSMWEYLDGIPEDEMGRYERYRPAPAEFEEISGKGFVQPYTDSPLDHEAVGENVYLGLIGTAKNYLWITTPYLIIDEQMEQALCTAAKSGVDVRIIIPGIPDKKIVKKTTDAFYPKLIQNGVKIYEFEPGFIHAKTFLCDDSFATVGSVNLDYRSLYLHFECGVWMYGSDSVFEIKKDFVETFEKSRLITDWEKGIVNRLLSGILKLIAPLL